MPEPSPLDDSHTSAHAWRRFRHMMRLMGVVTAVAVTGSMGYIYSQNGLESIHLYIATALGVTFAMMLTAALMGLVFLSSGTGHDEAVRDPLAEDDDQPDGRSR